MNYITNKTNNYIISSDLNVESRLNNSTLKQNKDSDRLRLVKATSIQSKMNKANNYAIEVARSYTSFTCQLNQIIVTSIISMDTIC